MIQLPTFYMSAIAGLWIFYIQHQFEETYWVSHGEWDYARAAMQGSSYYKLPKILQWFTGNIGLHHIHHLSPKIPNYHLQRCHDAYPMFQQVAPVKFWHSLKYASLKLWDEDKKKLVRFRDLDGIAGR